MTTKSAEVHLYTWELFLALVAACGKNPVSSIAPKRDNPVDWGRMNWGPLIIDEEVTADFVKLQIWNGLEGKYF